MHYVNLKQAKEKMETELLFLTDVNIRDWNACVASVSVQFRSNEKEEQESNSQRPHEKWRK